MRSNRLARTAAALLGIGLLSGAAFAQAPPARPKIGLALGGGGARGEAHVGVLKVLEELKIPVDYVVGTSMGSIVGGLYASGMSPEEMEKLLLTTDWASLFKDIPPRRLLDYRRKDLDRLFPFGAEFGLKGGKIALPPGLLAGEKLEFLLQSLTLRAGNPSDFDHLPIPFRAIATDIDTGEKVVIGKGSLPQAIRASMSLPGIFDPVVMDGRVLVDGGTVENIPVETVRAMGADIVIAVDVGMTLEGYKAPPANLLEVLMRLTDVPIRSNVLEARKVADILITPDLKGYTSASFDKGAELVPRGVAAAQAKSAELSRLAASGPEFEAFLARQRRPDGKAPMVDKVEIEPVEGLDPRRLAYRIKSKAGQPLDLDVLSQDLSRLYGTKLFEGVSFRFEQTPEGNVLTIEPHRRSWGPNTLRTGLNLATDFEGGDQLALLAAVNIKEVNSRGAEWRTVLEIGSDSFITSELYQPIDWEGRFFVSPYAAYLRRIVPRPLENVLLVDYRMENIGAGLDAGVSMGRFGEIRTGLRWAPGEAKPEVLAEGAEVLDADIGEWRTVAIVDQLDSVSVPREGYSGEAEFRLSREGLGAAADFERLFVSAMGVVSFGTQTVALRANLGEDFDGGLPFWERFQLGGLFRLSGTTPGAIDGDAARLASLLTYRRLFESPVGSLYLGVSLEAAAVSRTPDALESVARDIDDWIFGGSGFVAIDTLAGPLYLGYGYTEGGDRAAYLILGRIF
jgi:NTE family protein